MPDTLPASNLSEPDSSQPGCGPNAFGVSFQYLVENVNDGIFSLDENGLIEYFSPAVERLTGYSPKEIQGHPFTCYIFPEDITALKVAFYRTLRGELSPSEFRVVAKDGSLLHLLSSSRPRLRDGVAVGITGVLTDITKRVHAELALKEARADLERRVEERTRELMESNNNLHAEIAERRKAEQALLESERRFQRVAESTGEWIWEINHQGAYTYSNAVVEAILGFRPDEIVGRMSPQDFFAAQERDVLIKTFSELLAKQQPFTGFIGTLVHRDGHRVPMEIRGVPVLDEHGQLIGYRGTKTDITNRLRAEQARQNLERKIQEAQRLESLGLLAGGIAHDFNNILNAILGYLELSAMDLPENSPVQNRLDRAGKACHAAADLCRQMLAFSGRARFLVKPLDLNQAVADITRMLEVSVSKKATLHVHLAPYLPSIKADTAQLQQVIMNLVINASESLGTRSGTITLRTTFIHADQEYLSAARMAEELPEGNYVCFEVADTGCGMSSDALSRVFDPFFTTKFTGRGLGLAAVLGIVRGHKGGVRVQSRLGEGSTFTILFPAHEPVVTKPQTASAPSSWRGHGTILLVDDEVVLREVGKEFLDRLGFSTLTAKDGLEAVEMYQMHQDKLVCILLDLTMPRMDGIEAFHELRSMGCQIPVIIVSGFGERDMAENMTDQGLAGFIQKPYTRSILLTKLAEVLG